jgi:hypothetical protein
MTINLLGVMSVVLALTGCSTMSSDPAAKSETVLVTYHVKAGKEADLAEALAQGWSVYTRDHLVFERPHVVVRSPDGVGKTKFIEILTWVDSKTPEHAPEAVKAVWQTEEGLCERRNGHYGIEPGEVELLVPARNPESSRIILATGRK